MFEIQIWLPAVEMWATYTTAETEEQAKLIKGNLQWHNGIQWKIVEHI